MPGKRAKPDRRVEEALTALAAALDEAGAPWMVIGGLAVIARGVRRMTTDIDATVQGDAVTTGQLLAAAALHGIVPRIRNADAFARQNLVLLLRHASTEVDLDVSLAWSNFENEALAGRRETKFGRVRVPMVSAEDLIIFKAIAGRAKDLEDAEALLDLHPLVDFKRIRRHLAELAAAAGVPELATSFNAVLSKAHRARSARKP